jgi:hypothetical protein
MHFEQFPSKRQNVLFLVRRKFLFRRLPEVGYWRGDAKTFLGEGGGVSQESGALRGVVGQVYMVARKSRAGDFERLRSKWARLLNNASSFSSVDTPFIQLQSIQPCSWRKEICNTSTSRMNGSCCAVPMIEQTRSHSHHNVTGFVYRQE